MICVVAKGIWSFIAFFEQVFHIIQIVSGSLQFRVIDKTLDWCCYWCWSVCFALLRIEEWETMLFDNVIRRSWAFFENLLDMGNEILKMVCGERM